MTPAKEIKKELNAAFKGTKFSVTTKGVKVSVKWTLDVGSSATVSAVKLVLEGLGAAIAHGDYSIGNYDINFYPEFTQERREWSAALVDKYVDEAFYNGYCFYNAEGFPHYHANQDLKGFLEEGVVEPLIDHLGHENSQKGYFYAESPVEPVNPSTKVKLALTELFPGIGLEVVTDWASVKLLWKGHLEIYSALKEMAEAIVGPSYKVDPLPYLKDCLEF